ncbi:MAG: glycosyltransferase family 2 protein [Rhodocyclaceae bacterium]|nr:glycosyltransferase family 2 protein [Rhodocyclaceae bacterium]
MRFEDTCAVVVSYRYPYAELAELLRTLAASLGHVILVDNNVPADAADLPDLQAACPAVEVVANGDNLGLSKALNEGLRRALARGFQWMLLFDQDSRPGDDMIPALMRVRDGLRAAEPPVAAIGPAICDDRMRTPLPFIRFAGGRVIKRYPVPGEPGTIDADMLITSGCLIDASVLRRHGLMDERLFIDNIDLEWSFRVRAAGFRLVGVPGAVLAHRLGERVRSVPGTNRNILVHGPLRQYHIMRNRILMYWRPYVPLSWKIADVPRLLFKLVYFPLMVSPRGENLKKMLMGVWAGIRDRRLPPGY